MMICFECKKRMKVGEDKHVVIMPDGEERLFCSQKCRDQKRRER